MTWFPFNDMSRLHLHLKFLLIFFNVTVMVILGFISGLRMLAGKKCRIWKGASATLAQLFWKSSNSFRWTFVKLTKIQWIQLGGRTSLSGRPSRANEWKASKILEIKSSSQPHNSALSALNQKFVTKNEAKNGKFGDKEKGEYPIYPWPNPEKWAWNLPNLIFTSKQMRFG